jgi:hypothetical protein
MSEGRKGGNAKVYGWIAAALAAGMLSATPSFAETQWEKDHPRRDEVNDRLENQDQRIDEGVKHGTLTPQEARKLHHEDHAIRRQERRYARHHGGHISKEEQEKLNREENHVSNQIHQEKHD